MNDHNSHEEQVLKVTQDETSAGRGRGLGRSGFRGGATRGRGKGRGGRQPVEGQQLSVITTMCLDISNMNVQRSRKTAKQIMLRLVRKQCYSWHNFHQMENQMHKTCSPLI